MTTKEVNFRSSFPDHIQSKICYLQTGFLTLQSSRYFQMDIGWNKRTSNFENTVSCFVSTFRSSLLQISAWNLLQQSRDNQICAIRKLNFKFYCDLKPLQSSKYFSSCFRNHGGTRLRQSICLFVCNDRKHYTEGLNLSQTPSRKQRSMKEQIQAFVLQSLSQCSKSKRLSCVVNVIKEMIFF